MSQATIYSLLICIAFTALMAAWRIYKQGRESVNVMLLLLWAFGFYAGQQALGFLFKSNPTQLYWVQERDPNSPVTFQLESSTSLYGLAVTPDGSTAVTLSTAGVDVWDVKTGNGRWSVKNLEGKASLSRSGDLLAVREKGERFEHTIKIYNLDKGALLATLTGEPASAWTKYQMFSPNGAYLLVGSEDMNVAIYPLGTLDSDPDAAEQTIQPIIVPREIPASGYGLPASYQHMGFDGDNESLFVHAYDRLEQWTLGEQPQKLNDYLFADTINFKPSHFSDDGKQVFYCGTSTIELAGTYSSTEKEVLKLDVPQKLAPGSHSISSHCATSPDNAWFAFGMEESGGNQSIVYTLHIWKNDGTLATTDTDTQATKVIAPQVANLAFSPDSSTLYVMDDFLRLHVYGLGDNVKTAMLTPDQFGWATGPSALPLLAAADNGVLLSYHNANKAVWIPHSLSRPDH
ncbi:hypothetical protein JCM14076_12160 [Methylosoma difficile]